MHRSWIGPAVAALAAATALSGGGDDSANNPASALPQGSEEVKLDPADFTTNIDNPDWPMSPGSKWV